MTPLQQKLLDILLEVGRICDRHGLHYFLYYGTAIGAIRHQGFIPWDDDIDIGMLRPDYEQFLKIARQELPEKLFLQHWSTEPAFYMPFAKVRCNGTTIVEEAIKHLDLHHGIFIDIFPLDGVSERRWLARLQGRLLYLLRLLLDIKCCNYSESGIAGRVARRLLRPFLSARWLNCLFNRISQWWSPEETPLVSELYFTSGYDGRVSRREWFEGECRVEFEGHKLPVPQKYDVYLRKVYGDYMVLPPEGERLAHGSVVDLGEGCEKRNR